MIATVGVYNFKTDAEQAAAELMSAGFDKDAVNILTPGSEQEEQKVQTINGEQPGIVKAIGAVTGGAVGLGLGEGLATLLVPGVGAVLAIGLAGGALLGALAGGAVGGAAENTIFSGVPEDELLVYKDALRRGRTVVIAMAKDDARAELARDVFKHTGAESIDQARKMWWLGLRDVEKERYKADGRAARWNVADTKAAGGSTK